MFSTTRSFQRSRTTRFCVKYFSDIPTEDKLRRVPINQKVWNSKLNIFTSEKDSIASNLDFVNLWRQPFNMKKLWNHFTNSYELYNQRYISERHEILGSDLATAHFVVFRGGAVKFLNHSEWVRMNNDDDSYDLPKKYVPNLFLECIDASGTGLRYEGLVNFTNLKHLKWLSVNGCPLIDDWCLDRMSHMFRSIEYLDISNCNLISPNGLAALYRLKDLTVLKIENMKPSIELELSCYLIKDMNPNIKIEGLELQPDIQSSDAKVCDNFIK